MTSASTDNIVVTTHIARDFLQSAAVFKNDRLVVWEYAANSIQYTEIGRSPVVKITVDGRQKTITIADNGRGMDWSGLQNFFVMHGENVDRKAGRAGRGRFGTGKSAAFGIADFLRITTVRNGMRSCVELCRDDITAMKSGDPIPVQIVEREVATKNPNGTVVEIQKIHLKSLDIAGIGAYIQRHLARCPKDVSVYLNGHECDYIEPAVASVRQACPEGAFREALGDVQLILRVSKAPLEEDLRGVAIFSNGTWHQTTFAGSEGRDMTQYIFGEIDVARLDEDESPIPPFDMTRSMTLNPSNELVRMLFAFINREVEKLRRELVEHDRTQRNTQESQRLEREAQEIARVINEDFSDFRLRVERVRAKSGPVHDSLAANPEIVAPPPPVLIPGDQIPADPGAPFGNPGHSDGDGQSQGGPPRLLSPELRPPEGPDSPRIAKSSASSQRRARAGFAVEFKNMGKESNRAEFDRVVRVIFINLDHPQIETARGSDSVDDPTFRRLVYEVAFSEYAIALAAELANHDEFVDVTDPIFAIRETVNRMARRAASLYAQ